MATRQIKDAKDLNTNELIYFTGHAGATYMSDGSTVEDRINNLNNVDLTGYATETYVDNKVATKQDVISDLTTIRSNASKGATAVQPIALATVATSGSYNDLTNKPTIPAIITESTVSGWGFTKNTYVDNKVATKQDVISDLATIRSNASKGATAVQPSTLATVATSGSYNDLTNKPTIPAIVTESTVSGWGFTKNTYVDNKVATKQDKLVSGTNIKTINNQSIIGEGDINIVEGNPNANIEAIETSDLQIDDISINRQIINITDTDITLINNNYYKKTDVSSSITINLEPVENNTVTNYCIEFTTSSSGTSVALPSNIKWINGNAPVFENNCTYQISVVNNLGVCAKFA